MGMLYCIVVCFYEQTVIKEIIKLYAILLGDVFLLTSGVIERETALMEVMSSSAQNVSELQLL